MGRQEDIFTAQESRRDAVLPERQHPGERVLQRFRARHTGNTGIAWIVGRMPLVSGIERWRGNVVAPAPDFHLRLPVLRGRLSLVEALQCAVVTLVETPRAPDRNPHQVHFVQDQPQRADRPLQQRRIGNVEAVAERFQLASRLPGLALPLVGQVHIGPARKPVVEIPCALPVPAEDQLACHY